MMRVRSMRAVAVGAVLLLGAAACSSDGGGDGNAEAFCRLTEEANQQSGEATEAQIDAIVKAAPSEIRDDARTLGDALQKMQDDPEAAAELLADEEITAAGERVDAFETENCEEGR